MSRLTRRAALVVLAAAAACSPDHTPTAASSASRAGGIDAQRDVAEAAERARVASAAVAAVATLGELDARYQAGHPEIRAGSPVFVCRPERYDADVRVVGPEGGVLRAGRHVLTIPAGAVREPTVITMEAPPSLAAQVRFSPHGLRFEVPALLELDYARCTVPAGGAAGVAYVNDALDVLEWPASQVGQPGQVQARLEHFSAYVAAERSGGYIPAW